MDSLKNRFCSDPGGTQPLCNACANRTGWSCTAYPDGIPREILTGDINHTQSYAGDKGITFKPKE